MNRSPHENPAADAEALLLRQANADARALAARGSPRTASRPADQYLMERDAIEVWMPMASAVETIRAALGRLEATSPSKGSQIDPSVEGPTHRQGQFLAYICEYMSQNSAGLAPTHAAMQRFFGLTAPSVNSMLIRLEQRGFIRRTPRVAKGIEISIDPALIPPLEQPFKF